MTIWESKAFLNFCACFLYSWIITCLNIQLINLSLSCLRNLQALLLWHLHLIPPLQGWKKAWVYILFYRGPDSSEMTYEFLRFFLKFKFGIYLLTTYLYLSTDLSVIYLHSLLFAFLGTILKLMASLKLEKVS